MSQVICPKCGENTLDRLANCPVCNAPLVEGQKRNQVRNQRIYYFGLVFVSGLVAATLSSIVGFPKLAMTFAVIAVLGLVALVLKMNATN
jgi:Flp pilus assembly protein TadB